MYMACFVRGSKSRDGYSVSSGAVNFARFSYQAQDIINYFFIICKPFLNISGRTVDKFPFGI